MSKFVKVGAGWKKETKAGKGFISGKLNDGTMLSIWANEHKTADKHPDYEFSMDYETAQKLDLVSDYDKERLERDETNAQVKDEPF